MRVVFDTVVFVRALINPYGLWGRLVFGFPDRYELVLSEPIIREILEVLYRPEIVRKYRSVANRDLATIIELLGAVELVEPATTPSTSRDPKDDKFLATARAARARYLVSEDADLTDLKEYEGTLIVPARTFIEILEQEATS
jgi:putative PIN family toxin of toxin-antitoxin system